MQKLKIKNFNIGKGEPLTLIAGPCVIESRKMAFEIAKKLKETTDNYNINLIFKASYDKGNRTSLSSFRGPGIKEGLDILKQIKNEFDLPILTDIHHPEEATRVAQICDVIQIPAFLCRQTDLLIAAGKTGKTINIKKGQFASPISMRHATTKVLSTGNENIMLTERGTSFGYNNLITDVCSIPIMQQIGYPVCFDATHSVQIPSGADLCTGGNRSLIPIVTKAAIAAGANALFLEVHSNPEEAKCDKGSLLHLKDLPRLLNEVASIYNIVNV